MKKKILDNLSFGVVVISLLLIVVFKDKVQTMLFIASGGFILYGILAFLDGNRYGVVSLGCGISLFGTMLLYINEVLDKVDSITFIVCMSMSMIIVISYVFMFINEKAIFKKYSLIVEAEVVDLEKNPNTKKEYYSPVYAYSLKNKDYLVNLPYYINRNIPKIGDKIKLYVDPDDNLDVYFDKNLFNKIRYWGSGIVLIVVCIGIIVSLFR